MNYCLFFQNRVSSYNLREGKFFVSIKQYTGSLRIRQVQVELSMHFVGYGYVKTLQLNITDKQQTNTLAFAA